MSQYGATFDRLVTRWAALENEHDLVHPDRGQCGGVGGCAMMAAAVDREHEMMQELRRRRTRAARSTGKPRRVAPIDHDPGALARQMRYAGWRQTHLATAVGVGRSLMSEALKGTRGLSPEVMCKIAEVLGCPLDALYKSPTGAGTGADDD